MVRARVGDECQGGPLAGDVRMAQVSRCGPVLRPDRLGASLSPTNRRHRDGLPSPRPAPGLLREERTARGPVIGRQGWGRRDRSRRRVLVLPNRRSSSLRCCFRRDGGSLDGRRVVRWLDEEETSEVLLALELAGVPEALRAVRTSFRARRASTASVSRPPRRLSPPLPIRRSPPRPSPVRSTLLPLSGVVPASCSVAPHERAGTPRPCFHGHCARGARTDLARAAATGGPLDPPLLVVLDEAANVAPLVDLDRVLATATGGHGVQLVDGLAAV